MGKAQLDGDQEARRRAALLSMGKPSESTVQAFIAIYKALSEDPGSVLTMDELLKKTNRVLNDNPFVCALWFGINNHIIEMVSTNRYTTDSYTVRPDHEERYDIAAATYSNLPLRTRT